jgi:imidazolonepropionase-like amidohydrolase
MGVFALVKQTLLDAQRYSTVWSIYNAHPGARRPEYNRALESLQPLVGRRLPAIIPADSPTEIQRVLELASTFRLSLIVAGGAESGSIAPVLRERNVPILLSVKYPEPEKNADPEAREELSALRKRVKAPECAALLAKAGIRFAFQSGGLANPKDFIRNVSRAVEAGLDREKAIRALTLDPAEIFGVADRVGSIEKNKTANLILTTGDLFNADTHVKYAFVDGRKFDIVEPDPQRERDGEASGTPDLGSAGDRHKQQDAGGEQPW